MKITLPHANGLSIDINELLQILKDRKMKFIIQGQQHCSLKNHSKKSSLDYYLRLRSGQYINTCQADDSVINQICETGIFKVNIHLKCPETGRKCKGIEIVQTKYMNITI